jgi:invasion protein IalB
MKARHATCYYPDANLSEYDRDHNRFCLCDEDGCFAIVDLDSDVVRAMKTASSPSAREASSTSG